MIHDTRIAPNTIHEYHHMNYYNGFLKIFLLKYEVFIFFFIKLRLFVIITWYKGGFAHELW